MSQELGLLRFFCEDRSLEAQYYGYVEEVGNLEREIMLLFELVHDFYISYPEAAQLSKDDLVYYYNLNHPKSRSREMHLELINVAFAQDINPDLIKIHLDQLIEKHKASLIVNKLVPVLEGEQYGVLDTIRTDVDEYVSLLNNPPDRLVVPEPCKLSVQELVESEILDGGLPWHLPELTNIVGGVRRKTLGLIYAFVDSGKTSFSMSSCATFAREIPDGEHIAYCGNEESAVRLRLRLVQSILNWTRTEIKEDIKNAQKKADEKGLNKVLLFDEINTGDQFEYILQEYSPTIAYIDQSTDVDVKFRRGGREGVDYLKGLFKWYRSLANKYNCAIIGVAQGTGTAENIRYLKLSDIYGARVAIQGALDYAIGIGRLIEDPVDECQRYINVPKNKLHDGEGGKFAVMFNKYQNIWKEV